MAFTYCPSCGYKNQHGVNAPKFCGGCGKALGGPSVNKAKAPERRTASTLRSKKRPNVREDIEEESSEIDYVPDVSNFKYNVSKGDVGGEKMNFKDLAGEINEDELAKIKSDERGIRKENLNNGKTRKRKK